jgi:hypothetical protein
VRETGPFDSGGDLFDREGAGLVDQLLLGLVRKTNGP